MGVFDNNWLKLIHCLLWRLGEIDVWVFHRIMYELSREGLIEINDWTWYGECPRSSEVDAALALFEIINVIEYVDGRVKTRKEPLTQCVFSEKMEEIIEKYRGKETIVASEK